MQKMKPALLVILAGLALVSGASILEKAIGGGDIVKRDIANVSAPVFEGEENDGPSSQEKHRQMVKSGKALGKVLAKVLSLAGASGPSGVLSIGVIVVSYFLEELTKEKRTLWQQIEHKVDLKIGQKLSEYHMERLRNEVFRVLESRFQQTTNFDHADLRVVLDKRHMVFPHNWQVVGWSYELPLGIIYWMPFMIAGYQQMIKDDKIDKCSLANELTRTRAHVIASMKAMMQKRYKQLHGNKYDYDRVNYPCKRRRSLGSRLRRCRSLFSCGGGGGSWPRPKPVCVSIDRLLTWEDGLDGKSFTLRKRHTGWVGTSWAAKINQIRDATVNFLWKEVVEKVNEFYDPEICLATLGCKCPTKIQKSEIVFSFPEACMANGASGKCMHPCDDYGYDYEWCYIYRNPDQWSKCSQPDLNDCMPITVSPFQLPNVSPIYKSR